MKPSLGGNVPNRWLVVATAVAVAATSTGVVGHRSRSAPGSLVLTQPKAHGGRVHYQVLERDGARITHRGWLPRDSSLPSGDAWAPNGSAFVYVHQDRLGTKRHPRWGSTHLRVVDLASGRQRELALVRMGFSLPSVTWAGHNRSTIFYTTQRVIGCGWTGDVRLWKVSEGSQPVRVRYESSYRSVAGSEGRFLYRDAVHVLRDIDLLGASPNGDWLLIGRQRLYRIDLDGAKGPVVVTPLRMPIGFDRNGPTAVSPDGTTVAAALYRRHFGMHIVNDIWVIGTDGSGPRRLTRSEDDPQDTSDGFLAPVWSSSGRFVAAIRTEPPTQLGDAGASYVIPVVARTRPRRLPVASGTGIHPIGFDAGGRLLVSRFGPGRHQSIGSFDLDSNILTPVFSHSYLDFRLRAD